MSAPVLAVCSMDMFVQAPVTMTVSRPSPCSRFSRRVPCQALMRIFSTTKSPSCASSPSAGAAPHVPRTTPFDPFTPSKSGALSFRPGAPGSTMYQTWITGTPFARQAAASPFTFSTTFCSFACCGDPESAQQPPSTMTSFCRSWMSIAQRPASSFSSSFTVPPPTWYLAHIWLAARADERRDRVQGRRRRDEERVPVRPAPCEVADVLGDPDRADVLARRRDHPDPTRPGHPDVPALVALHPVGDPLFDHAAADALEE